MEKYVEPFIEVCETVFAQQGNVKVIAERPYILTVDALTGGDISAVIGFSGEARGAVVLSMKKELAFDLVSKLVGVTHDEINEEVLDVIGEILNIIAGQAKQRLENDFALTISLPTIVRGQDLKTSWPGNMGRVVCIPFKVFDAAQFTLAVALETGA
jgi:chemotaxis protein CheX